MAIVIPYVKQTWTDGSGGGTPISAARLGVLEEGILDASLAPAVRAFHNANQSIASDGAWHALALNSERFDQAGGSSSTMHDTVTNNSRLTAIYAGIYLITGSVEFAANATGTRWLRIFLNNTTAIADVDDSGTLTPSVLMTVTTVYSLAVNDFVELSVQQNSGGALNILSSGNYSPEFSMVRLA